MKKSWKKWLLVIIILIAVVFLSIVGYFYFALSGNPFMMWSQQRDVLKIYEERYRESFKITDSNYDYKRKEYEIELAPKDNPELTFETTVYEAKQIDKYGRLRAINYFREQISDALGLDYSDLEYTFNVFEDYDSVGILEMDLMTRLTLNKYTVDFSFDVTSIDEEELDALFQEIHGKILQSTELPLKLTTFRFGAYDGTNYYHAELPNIFP